MLFHTKCQKIRTKEITLEDIISRLVETKLLQRNTPKGKRLYLPCNNKKRGFSGRNTRHKLIVLPSVEHKWKHSPVLIFKAEITQMLEGSKRAIDKFREGIRAREKMTF